MLFTLATVPEWVLSLPSRVDGDATLIAVTWIACLACWLADHS